MKIFSLEIDLAIKHVFVYCEDNSVLLAGKSKIDRNTFLCLGEKKSDTWAPSEIEWFKDDGRNLEKYKEPDISYIFMRSSLIASPDTADLIRPAIENEVELLPIPFNNKTWYFLNVFNHIDALDKVNSLYKIYRSGKIGPLTKPAFFPEKIPHAKLFMIPEDPTTIYYAEHHPDSDPGTFKNILEQNRLFGINLEKQQEY
jgi:hypothetical protein